MHRPAALRSAVETELWPCFTKHGCKNPSCRYPYQATPRLSVVILRAFEQLGRKLNINELQRKKGLKDLREKRYYCVASPTPF